MSNLHDTDYILRLKQGLVANINTTATKNSAVLGEPHYATDTKVLYVFDGTQNTPVGSKMVMAIKSADYTLTTTDQVVVFTASATATLPSATGSGQMYRIKSRKGSGATVTVDANSSETIDGSLVQYVTDGNSITIIDSASGVWEII